MMPSFNLSSKTLIAIICAITIISCGENMQQQGSEKIIRFPNGKMKEKLIKVRGDSIDFKVETYYPSGMLESQYSLKNSRRHGYMKNYYPNGKIDYEGYFVDGRKKGFFKYHDSTGRLEKMINFINYRDSSVARPNEVIRFNEWGDTLYDKSYFYNFYRKSDTLKSPFDSYQFKFISRGKLFKYSYIVFCNLDEKFNSVGTDKPISVLMEENQIELSRSDNKIGANYLTGYILNTDTPISADGRVIGRSIEMYFYRKYFVKP
jgi:antitoxin component YwqK of YwqJK toxin-antitoxin module